MSSSQNLTLRTQGIDGNGLQEPDWGPKEGALVSPDTPRHETRVGKGGSHDKGPGPGSCIPEGCAVLDPSPEK